MEPERLDEIKRLAEEVKRLAPWSIIIEIAGDTSPDVIEGVITGINDTLDDFEVQATVHVMEKP